MDIFKDVFFSYHTDSSVNIVEDAAKMLEHFDITSWYAKRDIKATQNYTEIIPDAIRGCKLFVVIINKYSADSVQVSREMNIALDMKKTILMINTDGTSVSKNSLIYIAGATSQMITIIESDTHTLAQEMCRNIVDWFQDNGDLSIESSMGNANCKTFWDVNDLEFFGDEGERKRIDLQHHFVYLFAKDVYDRLLIDTENASFLDVGCNTGVQSKMFLENKTIKHYVGIDREAAALEQAAISFPAGHLYQCDCESAEFSDRLTQIEKELGISGFDYINISMLLLHTRNPSILIDVLSDHLTENGRIIVLDIDDGFNIAYPDTEGMFEKAVQLCFKTEYSGFRHCGRAINKFFSDTDLNDITLHKLGLSTCGMTRKEREYFFDIYFWFVLDDLQKMHNECPEDKFIKADYEWLRDNYAVMKNTFKKKDFFFNLGFVLYSAKA